jgi:multidrug efflux pump subunit AcrB
MCEPVRPQCQRRHRAARLIKQRCVPFSSSYRVPRHNLCPAAQIDGAAAPGYSQGQAIAIMAKLAAELLPDGFGYEWTALAFQQIRAASTAAFVFSLAVAFVCLVLAAQFDSLTLPLAVILIVPMCLVASITGVILRGMDNNILAEVGFVVLMGLAAKNAVLIIEIRRAARRRARFALPMLVYLRTSTCYGIFMMTVGDIERAFGQLAPAQRNGSRRV